MQGRGFLAVAVLFSLGCASAPPPPEAPPSEVVRDLERTAGATLQSCGEGVESRDDTKCKIGPVMECVKSALDACRPAHGTHVYVAGATETVRVDYFVVQQAGGGCEFVVVEDRASKPLQAVVCGDVSWKAHPAIDSCDVLSVSACQPRG